MNSWSDLLNKSQEKITKDNPNAGVEYLLSQKDEFIKELSKITGRNTILYFSAFMHKQTVLDVNINDKDINAFMENIHDMDRNLGIDLILHTPGGDLAATEQIIHYLRSAFNGDIRAIIPQMAMSAGSMIAVSCKSVIMGRQSCLGPFDPQLNGIPCQSVIKEFYSAVKDIEEHPVSWVCNNNNSNSASGLFDTSNIADSLRDKRTYYIADEISLLHKKYTENPDVIKYGSENALRVMKNSKLVIDAAKKTFGIDISCNVSPKSNNLVKDILCITHALRNIETDDIMFAKPAEDELDFFYAFSNKRVMKLQSSFPRQQDDEVIVSFYKMGDLLYMNNMPLKSLVNDLENYL